MADSTIDDGLFVLFDNWPGQAWQTNATPTDGFTSTSNGFNAATAAYALGTKIVVNCTSTYTKGQATLIYLYLESKHAAGGIGAKHLVTVESNSTSGAVGDPYSVTNDVGQDLPNGCLAAYALGNMTTGRYGWFWCGGVPPVEHCTALNGNYATNSSVAVGKMMMLADLATTSTTYGSMGLALLATNVDGAGIGVALKADA